MFSQFQPLYATFSGTNFELEVRNEKPDSLDPACDDVFDGTCDGLGPSHKLLCWLLQQQQSLPVLHQWQLYLVVMENGQRELGATTRRTRQ